MKKSDAAIWSILWIGAALGSSFAWADFAPPGPVKCFPAPAEAGTVGENQDTIGSGITAQYEIAPGTRKNTIRFNFPPESSTPNHIYVGVNLGGELMEIGFQKVKARHIWQPFFRTTRKDFAGTACSNGSCVGLNRHPLAGYVDIGGPVLKPNQHWTTADANRDAKAIQRHEKLHVPYPPGLRKNLAKALETGPGGAMEITTVYDRAAHEVRITFADPTNPSQNFTVKARATKLPKFLLTSQQAVNDTAKSAPRKTVCRDLGGVFSRVRSSAKLLPSHRPGSFAVNGVSRVGQGFSSEAPPLQAITDRGDEGSADAPSSGSESAPVSQGSDAGSAD